MQLMISLRRIQRLLHLFSAQVRVTILQTAVASPAGRIGRGEGGVGAAEEIFEMLPGGFPGGKKNPFSPPEFQPVASFWVLFAFERLDDNRGSNTTLSLGHMTLARR